MIENGKISSNQFLLLVLMFTIGSSLLFIPNILAKVAGRDAWISSIIGILLGGLLSLFYSKVASLRPGDTFVQLADYVFGNWIGRMISILFCIFLFIITGLVIRNIVDFINITFLVETPPFAIYILFFCIVMMAFRLGIETIGRSVQVLFIPVILLYLLTLFGLTPKLDFGHLKPVLEHGSKPVFKSVLLSMGSPFLELSAFLMITPFVIESKKKHSAFLWGASLGALFLAIPVIYCLCILGENLTADTTYPYLYVTKLINIGNFFQRVEVFIAMNAFLCIFIKASISFYGLLSGVSHIFGMKDIKLLSFPLTLLLFVFGNVAYPSFVYEMSFIKETWMPYALTMGLLLPLLLLIGWYIREKTSVKG